MRDSAQINKTAIDAGDAIVRTQLIERNTTPHVTAAMDQFGMAAVHLSITADSSLQNRKRRGEDAHGRDGNAHSGHRGHSDDHGRRSDGE